MKLVCLGDGPIVERALLRPNVELGCPFNIELISRNDRRRAELGAAYAIDTRGRSAAEALADETVRAAYVALPNHMHVEAALAAIKAGKAVLVEKPLAVTVMEVASLRNAAERYGGILVEGVMTQHHLWPAEFAEWVSGRPNASAFTCIVFSLSAERLERMPPPRLGGGAWFDAASYWAEFLQATGLGLPEAVTLVSERRSPSGLDLSIEIDAVAGGRAVRFFAALDAPFEASHTLRDGEDVLRTPNFLRPTVPRSAIRIEEKRNGTVMDRWVKGPGYYAAQLAYFYERIHGRDSKVDIGLFERAAFISAIGQALATRTDRVLPPCPLPWRISE